MKEPRFVPVGRIGRPHGVRGALKVYPYGESLAACEAGCETVVRPGEKDERRLTLASLGRGGGGSVVVEFREISSREAAEALTGEDLHLSEALLPATEEGEYYHYQLVGLTVETTSGERLGVLQGVLETGGNDVYVVDRGGRELLIPAISDVILRVDLEGGRMVVDLPEGLSDDL